jgi:hypothetical protein
LDVIATTLGVDVGTVVAIDRRLHEAGVRPHRRGRGAVATADHAAAVLAATMVMSTSHGGVVRVADAASDYLALPTDDGGEAFAAFGVAAALPAEHTFRAVLTALIQCAADGELETAIARWAAAWSAKYPQSPGAFRWGIEIVIHRPWPAASISISTGLDHREIFYSSPMGDDHPANQAWAIDQAARYGMGDLRERRSISARTIQTLGDFLAAGRALNA